MPDKSADDLPIAEAEKSVPVMVQEIPQPYGGAKSFTEVDAYVVSDQQEYAVRSQVDAFNLIIQNIQNDNTLSVVQKSTLIGVAATELPNRVKDAQPLWKSMDEDEVLDDNKVIKHEGSKWVLYTSDGSKVLGTFDTEADAKKREGQIQFFKHQKDIGEKAGPHSTAGIKFVIGRPTGKTSTEVQTVIFDKADWNAADAKAWLKTAKMSSGSMDETGDSFRFRQKPPGDFEQNSFRTIAPGAQKGGKSWSDKVKQVLTDIKELLTGQPEIDVTDVMLDAEPGAFKVYQDRSGRARWIGFSANAFQDRQTEIFATKALEGAVAYSDSIGDRGPLLLWHTPAAVIGECDLQDVVGRVLVESGPFANTELGHKAEQYFLAHPDEKFQMSVGYKYRPIERATGVYHWMRVFERSIVPAGKAANPWTQFTIQGDTDMSNPVKTKMFEDILGADLTQQVFQEAETLTKALEEKVAFKADPDPEPKPDPEPTEPPVEAQKADGDVAQVPTETPVENPIVALFGKIMEPVAAQLTAIHGEVSELKTRLDAQDGEVKSMKKSMDEAVAETIRPRTVVPASESSDNVIGTKEGDGTDDKGGQNHEAAPYVADFLKTIGAAPKE